ncbi:MAG: hypothetical protein AAF197_03460 [Pseudomonadota bacterium]
MSTKNNMNQRIMVSLLMLTGFAAILITGVLSYVLRYSTFLSAVHTIFGLLFVIYSVFHIKNNLRAVVNYLKQKIGRRWLWGGLTLALITTVGVAANVPPFKQVIDLGYALKELRPIDREVTQTLTTRFDIEGRALLVDVKAGDSYTGLGPVVMGVQITTVPQMAIWVEDLDGKYIETLYVTKKGATGTYFGDLFSEEEVRRPEALPHWSYSRGVSAEDGLLTPSKAMPLADAVTGATPLTSYELQTTMKNQLDEVVVKMEINRSFDYNDTYSLDAFPDDPVYSGSGNSAQPSLIYAATVNIASGDQFTFLELIGRGHHSGQHGEIIKDLDGVTTAKQLVHRVIVENQSMSSI